MSAKIKSFALVGVDAVPVDIRADVAHEAWGPHVVGLPSMAALGVEQRLREALDALKEEPLPEQVAVCLSPTALDKQGCGFDLPILLAILGAHSRCSLDALDGLIVVGEVGFDGSLVAVKGALTAAALARAQGWRGVLVPRANAHEAAMVDGIEVYSASHLGEVLEALKQGLPLPFDDSPPRSAWPWDSDIADVPDQPMARAALEIAAAGGHNLLMLGSPGNSATLLASSLATILPVMSPDELLETMKVYSAIGHGERVSASRPVCAPHHTMDILSLTGGGRSQEIGELSLAHNGVLFLRELEQFSIAAMAALLKPLQERTVETLRSTGRVTLPASFLLVAAASPCPCGWLNSGVKDCWCTESARERWWARISRALLDRMDLQVWLKRSAYVEDWSTTPPERSETVRARVEEARARQHRRLEPWRIRTNAEMSMEATSATCTLDGRGEAALAELAGSIGSLTKTEIARMLRVARTIADLKGLDEIDDACLREAWTYRVDSAAPSPRAHTGAASTRSRTRAGFSDGHL